MATSIASTIQPLSVGPSAPIPTFAVHREIQGVPTQLTIQTYDDRIMVLLTQLGNRIGCLTQASLPASIPLTTPKVRQTSEETDASSSAQILSLLPTPSPSISLLPLIGVPVNQAQHDFYVSQIAAVVWWLLESAALSGETSKSTAARRPIVVGLALKRSARVREDDEDADIDESKSENDRESFAQIVSMIAEWPGR